MGSAHGAGLGIAHTVRAMRLSCRNAAFVKVLAAFEIHPDAATRRAASGKAYPDENARQMSYG